MLGGLGLNKSTLKKLGAGVGVATITTLALNRLGINIPFADYVVPFVVAGPVGLMGKIGVDMVMGGSIPFLGGSAPSSNLVV